LSNQGKPQQAKPERDVERHSRAPTRARAASYHLGFWASPLLPEAPTPSQAASRLPNTSRTEAPRTPHLCRTAPRRTQRSVGVHRQARLPGSVAPPPPPRQRRTCGDVAQVGPPPIKAVMAVPSWVCASSSPFPTPVAISGARRGPCSTRRRRRASQPIPSPSLRWS
jgi:hypothetical protein